ncbi:DNA alkylation repair protein [Pseudobdellovibrio sp. HCB154]|uniref:DNA alkylation repair protein n=1 Tax=Pseudobdellovibrio sp. HCB154 TaxID=3386277 RepID=UPI003917473E
MKKLIPAQIALRKVAKAKNVEALKYFFKTGPGEYGEGDEFIGVSVPTNRHVALKFLDISDKDLSLLLHSPVHEDRALGLHILTEKYRKTKDLKTRKALVNFYIKHRKFVNNWDLVDMSCYKILGHYCNLIKDHSLLIKLSNSKVHWDKRIAMVGTMALIREHDLDLTFQFAERFLNEKEDLMHKASGWLLREAGKKDKKRLLKFIERFGKRMPRTMLRYAIEKLAPDHRKEILLKTK